MTYVNPKLDRALDRMIQIGELTRDGKADAQLLARLAAQSYIFLGYVVVNERDVALLKQAVADRSSVNLRNDIVTLDGALYRLRHGVERHFVQDPNDEEALVRASAAIPVMFESMNAKAGHPCDVMHVLYLDGHIEAIPFGTRFPSLQSFMDAFPPPEVKIP
jgi:hypothetical protein